MDPAQQSGRALKESPRAPTSTQSYVSQASQAAPLRMTAATTPRGFCED